MLCDNLQSVNCVLAICKNKSTSILFQIYVRKMTTVPKYSSSYPVPINLNALFVYIKQCIDSDNQVFVTLFEDLAFSTTALDRATFNSIIHIHNTTQHNNKLLCQLIKSHLNRTITRRPRRLNKKKIFEIKEENLENENNNNNMTFEQILEEAAMADQAATVDTETMIVEGPMTYAEFMSKQANTEEHLSTTYKETTTENPVNHDILECIVQEIFSDSDTFPLNEENININE